MKGHRGRGREGEGGPGGGAGGRSCALAPQRGKERGRRGDWPLARGKRQGAQAWAGAGCRKGGRGREGLSGRRGWGQRGLAEGGAHRSG